MPAIIARMLVTLMTVAAAVPCAAQPAGERTIDEIRDESIARSQRGGYPLIGLAPDDVREAFAKISSRDGDQWAAAFMSVADRYAARARELAAAGDPGGARANWLKAWRLDGFGAWPVASTPGKERAYEAALAAFLAASATLDPPLEVVRIPFEGRDIVGYLRLPAAAGPVPVVFAVAGLDSRKENLMDQFAPVLGDGIAVFALDSPGTGQSPIKAGPSADREFSRALDYLATRKDIDAARIVLHGVSFGGYWAAKLAVVEKARLRAVSAQSPAVHDTFQPEFLKSRISGNREYLFDYVPAQIAVFEGVSTVDDLVAMYPRMSLVTQGLIGRPTTPMLIVGGARDTQVPISDAFRLLAAGDTPKDAWINPAGGHLGRQSGVWPDPVIFEKVILPWVVRMAKQPGQGPAEAPAKGLPNAP